MKSEEILKTIKPNDIIYIEGEDYSIPDGEYKVKRIDMDTVDDDYQHILIYIDNGRDDYWVNDNYVRHKVHKELIGGELI